jgi:hypothetical protein
LIQSVKDKKSIKVKTSIRFCAEFPKPVLNVEKIFQVSRSRVDLGHVLLRPNELKKFLQTEQSKKEFGSNHQVRT